MRLLAFDTATEACSVALEVDGAVHARHLEQPRAHGERLLAMIDEVLAAGGIARAELDALAFGRGPGGFTSLRIGAGVAQGIAYGLDLPVIPVSSLAVLAQGAARGHGVERALAALDARMGEVYWGAFAADANGIMQPAGGEHVLPPERVECPPGTGWCACGTGWESYRDALLQRCGDALQGITGPRLPNAVDLLPLAAAARDRGEAVAAEHAVPVYLRDRVAEKKRR
ncbi:MAG: tRNA (adenosine(37)-N6)-threonylcarbamoyltransferase complex dimerization subunit type 1 TsaB [Halofilum sp. (in: g-proteobacteria)]|nr:tRNA (adenosine(37)-N6)-threonylcarbamoyltransferase complex dimerization subunit type 1 TsaB [Halofilum sp. (in: g-proteobacteria)]